MSKPPIQHVMSQFARSTREPHPCEPVAIPADATVLPMGDMTECPQCGQWALYGRAGGIIGCADCGETRV